MDRKYGFSLAEALIMLLIVSLLAIASIPVLTKKKRDIAYRGKYECYVNDQLALPIYFSKTTIDDVSTIKAEPNYCSFIPPLKAKNFKITLVGGGGGGANGTSGGYSELNLSDTGFTVAQAGKYSMTLQGGSGAGGDMECGNPKDIYSRYGVSSSYPPSVFYNTKPSDVEKRISPNAPDFDSVGPAYDVVGYDVPSNEKVFYDKLLSNEGSDAISKYYTTDYRKSGVCFAEKDWKPFTYASYKADGDKMYVMDKCWFMPAQAGEDGQTIDQVVELQKNTFVTFAKGEASDYVSHKPGYKSCVSINGKLLCAAGGKPGYSRVIQNLSYKNVPLNKIYYKYKPRCESNYKYYYADSYETCPNGYDMYTETNGVKKCRDRVYDDDYKTYACETSGWDSCAEKKPDEDDDPTNDVCIGKCTSNFKYWTTSTIQKCPERYSRYKYDTVKNDCRERQIDNDFDIKACDASGINWHYYDSSSIVYNKKITYDRSAFSVPACINSELNGGHPYYDSQLTVKTVGALYDYKADRPYDTDVYKDENIPSFQFGGWGAGIAEFLAKLETFTSDAMLDNEEEKSLFKGRSGQQGEISIRNATFAGGGGGKPGQVLYLSERKLPQLNIRIGRGGSADSNGTSTSISGTGLSVEAAGGLAGKKDTVYEVITVGGVKGSPGENGGYSPVGGTDKSTPLVVPFGGYSNYNFINGFSIPLKIAFGHKNYPYGAGGGGGAGMTSARGTGGKGASGIVIIEWN